mgnify:CR=1 FL=1
MLLLICNRELLFIGKRKDEDDMAKSTKTYEERIRALEKKEQESIEATKKLIAQRKELEKTEAMIYLHARRLYHVLLLIRNRELMFAKERRM